MRATESNKKTQNDGNDVYLCPYGTNRGYRRQRAWCIQEPLVVRDRHGRPIRGLPGGALFLSVCGGSALSGDRGPWNVIFCLSCLILGFLDCVYTVSFFITDVPLLLYIIILSAVCSSS